MPELVGGIARNVEGDLPTSRRKKREKYEGSAKPSWTEIWLALRLVPLSRRCASRAIARRKIRPGVVCERAGVRLVFGSGGQALRHLRAPEIEAAIMAECSAHELPAGVVGEVPAPALGAPADDPCAALLRASASAAARVGYSLIVSGTATLPQARAVLAVTATAGLPADRVVISGAQRLFGASMENIFELAALETTLVCTDLGRLPTVHTHISDHEVAVGILQLAAAGAADRLALATNIARKHRQTAYGGNGLEFVAQQFSPYLRALGADDVLIRALTVTTAARVLARTEPTR